MTASTVDGGDPRLPEGAGVQAARAEDARELAAAHRREQDLTQDNGALRVRLVQPGAGHCLRWF